MLLSYMANQLLMFIFCKLVALSDDSFLIEKEGAI